MCSDLKHESKPNTIVAIGAQWGNEGKGRLIANLSQSADVCARFNGGANNIHTLTIGGNGEVHIGRDTVPGDIGSRSLLLRLLPLGVINKSCAIVLGNGMVIHLPTLLKEIREIESTFDKDIMNRIFISSRAHVVFDFHLEMDRVFDELRGSKLGTTLKGIGPAYSTKTIRNGIRMADLSSDSATLHDKIRDLIQYFEKFHTGLKVDVEEVVFSTLSVFKAIEPRVVDTVALMSNFMKEGKAIVCESADSVMSDIDFGTYPFVTSANTTCGAASVGLGIPPTKIGTVIGVCKSFTSRTQHWFPSVLDPASQEAKHLIEKGKEIGTTSNRPRRVGWLDLVQLKYACDISGFDSLLLTKLDALSGLDKIGMVTGYSNFNVDVDGYPSSIEDYMKIEPVVEYMDGWKEPLSSVSSFTDLPETAKQFIARIEKFVECPVMRIQVGLNIIAQ